MQLLMVVVSMTEPITEIMEPIVIGIEIASTIFNNYPFDFHFSEDFCPATGIILCLL